MTRGQGRAVFLCLLAVAGGPWRWLAASAEPGEPCETGRVERVDLAGARLVCLDSAGRVPDCRPALAGAIGPGDRVLRDAAGGCRRAPEPMAAERRLALGLRLDANTEPLEGLLAVPGIGPRMATKIRDARPFTSEADLERVRGIGPKTRARFVRWLAVGKRPASRTGPAPESAASAGGGRGRGG